MRIDELDYELPDALIAQHPTQTRDGARLLHLDRAREEPVHRQVLDLPSLLPPSLLVLNDTRVFPARLRGVRSSGGQVELLLIERVEGDANTALWVAMGRASKPLRPGTEIRFGTGELTARIERRLEEGRKLVRLSATDDLMQTIERIGEVPLPPYIRRAADDVDRQRYQTVFARETGAIAAPTAGLHLSETLIDALRAAGHRFAYVTLHVGPGTFAPLRSEQLAEHPMHRERYFVPEATVAEIAAAKESGRSVLAVGTTVVRTLESAAHAGSLRAGWSDTALFIYPPYRFQVVDALLTNFHLPRSTLLALVMAFAGVERVRAAYATAVREQYRFFSYGDAMLIGGTP